MVILMLRIFKSIAQRKEAKLAKEKQEFIKRLKKGNNTRTDDPGPSLLGGEGSLYD